MIHRLLAVIYPDGLTRRSQLLLVLGVVINGAAYAWRHQTGKQEERPGFRD